ncbi:SnoaL-like polyketide cyclase [Microlunatus sagamiharensis]|uniref:SnoaL-like polyketide cyclase n=1 Tax=Microlunatus sagamiharensis TaxID=546874 RepID=A0A1H2LJA3_9ACTN|nr:ester cyclase [Microlunatus sagamiharensis]SDU81113.1 SnoaL-like polyketide cyclase [Microlunatus sagamiharensis]
MPLDPIAYKPYADPDDFIREVTDLIWVDRAIGHIYENYEPDAIVHGSYGTSVGVEEVVQGSLMRISATPDRVGQAEDVVWEARGEDAFLSSHLVLSVDQSTDFISRTIANCLYRRGRMVEEWVVRDSLAICQQLGQDPDEVARVKPFIGYSGSMTEPAPQNVLAVGDSGERPDEYRAEAQMVLEFIDRVWNRRDLNAVEHYWIRDLVLHTIGYRTFTRPEGYRRALLKMLQPFPGGRFEVRDVQTHYAVRYAGLRVAVTWVYKGDYNGADDFGPLTGTPVEILGVSQFLVQDGRLVREVRVYDEIAVRSQIHNRRGDSTYASTNIY